MPANSSSPPGLLAAARQVGCSVLGLLETRIALIGVELQEEKLRTLQSLAWLGLAGALGTAGVLVAVGALALFAWSRAGYAGLGVVSFLCVAPAALIGWAVQRAIKHDPPPFAATAREFRKDLECLHG